MMMLVSFSLAADYTLRINSLLVPFAAFRGTAIGVEVLRLLRHSTGVEGTGIVGYRLAEPKVGTRAS
jgi:hypothetical protein